MENDYFRRANQYHNEIYDLMKRVNSDAFYIISISIEQYTKAGEDKEIEEDPAAKAYSAKYKPKRCSV